MEDHELDTLLGVLENPIRRRIVKRLSQGPSYALQLAKELGLGQPLVAKHLEMMEGAGVVSSLREPSETGSVGRGPVCGWIDMSSPAQARAHRAASK